MKVSVKLQDHHHQNHQKDHRHPPLLLRAKIPITILNFPFFSHFSTTTVHPSDLSLSLSTNFTSGPSLKLSYATATSTTPPLSLTLKSGTGIFGSPKKSPLIISANFSFNPSNPNNPNPTFSLLFKPQLGSFSLRKSTFSHSKPEFTNGIAGFESNDSNSFGFVPLDSPAVIKDLSVEKSYKYPFFKDIQLNADTHMPIAKRVAVNFRWMLDFPADKVPILRINKIGIERVEQVMIKKDDGIKKKSEGEVEMLKGVCSWMKRELDGLTRVNKEMKYELEEMRAGYMSRGGDFKEGVQKKALPKVASQAKGGFEQWKSTKNGGSYENVIKEENKNVNHLALDVESELQKAIKAAASPSFSP